MSTRFIAIRPRVATWKIRTLRNHFVAAFACASTIACSAIDTRHNSAGTIDFPAREKAEMVVAPMHDPYAIRLYPTNRKGVVQSDLESAGVRFTDDEYGTIIFNVDSDFRSIIPSLAAAELSASRRIVLDSDGSESSKAVMSRICMQITGAELVASGILIFNVRDGAMAVTPIETENEFLQRRSAAGGRVSRGNTARHLFTTDR